jgi:PleD family two-component response regulator
MAERKKILVASAHSAYNRLFAILPGYDLRFVETVAAAQSALKANGFSLIMIGIYFEQSKMFEFLRYIKADHKYADIPVVCFRGILLSDSFDAKPFELRCKALGASAFLDLTAFTDDAFGNAALRNRLTSLL